MMLYKSKYTLLLYTLLFSVLGCFSYFFIVEYTDIPVLYRNSLISFDGFFIVILVFNILGHILSFINEKIGLETMSFSGSKVNLILYFILIGVSLFLLNYLMLICIKWIVGLPEPLVLQTHGTRMLFIIWLVQLIMVAQITTSSFYRQLAHLYRKNSELEDSATKAKYQALQNQLNPHFLFNSLNTLVSEIEYNPQNATLFTHHLADVYRYILQNNDQQLTPLRTELDFLKSFMFLHQVRLGKCIHVENQVDNSMYDMKVPPLTLQLLVENVIKHNIISSSKPMVIHISIDEQDGMLTIINNMQIKKILTPSGKGLLNLSERYRLLCGRDIEVKTDNNCFIVKVPLLNE